MKYTTATYEVSQGCFSHGVNRGAALPSSSQALHQPCVSGPWDKGWKRPLRSLGLNITLPPTLPVSTHTGLKPRAEA